jgi:uncharacterized membrane protein YfhO
LYGGGRWSYAALELEVMIHFLLTSILMYLLVREITGKPFGGLIAAIAYTYGGYLNSFPIQQVTMLESGTWLPLALFGIHRASRDLGSWGWLVVAGLGMGLTFLGGHPQIAMLCGYLCIAYLGYRTYVKAQSRREFVVRFVASSALFGLIGVGLAAIMLLPSIEFQQLATRATDLNYTTKSGGYPFIDVLQLVWSTMTNLYAPMYIGIIGLTLAGIAVIYGPSEARFWVAAGVIALILGFGGKTALFQFAYTLIPGASLFRNQERTVMIWSICASILAGIGAVRLSEGFTSEAKKWVRNALWILAAVTLVYLLLMRDGVVNTSNTALLVATFTVIVCIVTAAVVTWVIQNPAKRQFAIVAVLVFDLFSLWQGGPAFSPGSPDGILPESPWMPNIRQLLAADPFARIDGTDKLGPFGTLYGLPTIRGTGPLRLAGSERLLALPPGKYWDLLAVRYVISAEGQLLVPAKRIQDVNDWSGAYFVYELENPRPLATLVYSADVVPNDDYAPQVMAASDYPVRDRAMLSQPPPIGLGGQRPPDANVTLMEIIPERLRMRASTSANALLMVSIPYHPGWKASTGGQPLTILRADLGLMAIPLVASNQEIEIQIEFRPTTVQVGGIVSAVTLLIAVLLLLIWLSRKRISETA